MKAVLLAAGRGKRLRPLTDHTPKPLISIGGKPILEWIIEGLKQEGITDFAIIIGHLGETLKSHFQTNPIPGVTVSFFEQAVRDGTARAVLPARDFVGSNPFFLGYGDIFIAPENYGTLIRKFKSNPSEGVLGVRHVADPSSGGAVLVQDDRLLDLVEKPDSGNAPSNLINAGIMMMPPEIMAHIEQVQPSKRGEYELTDALLSLARSTGVRICRITRFWSDVGTPEKLREADTWIQAHIKKAGENPPA